MTPTPFLCAQDQVYIKSAASEDVDLCLECFSVGVEMKDPKRTDGKHPHRNNCSYRYVSPKSSHHAMQTSLFMTKFRLEIAREQGHGTARLSTHHSRLDGTRGARAARWTRYVRPRCGHVSCFCLPLHYHCIKEASDVCMSMNTSFTKKNTIIHSPLSHKRRTSFL
jgi:hypothetical protein